MKSPFTGGKVIKKTEQKTANYRGKEYEYMYTCYVCVDTNTEFTTTALDEKNTKQVYDQYRLEFGIPFPNEIRSIREKFNLSASMMSLILGFGENQYRLYENGEMPSLSNGRILNCIIKYPQVIQAFVDSAKRELPTRKYNFLKSKIASL